MTVLIWKSIYRYPL